MCVSKLDSLTDEDLTCNTRADCINPTRSNCNPRYSRGSGDTFSCGVVTPLSNDCIDMEDESNCNEISHCTWKNNTCQRNKDVLNIYGSSQVGDVMSVYGKTQDTYRTNNNSFDEIVNIKTPECPDSNTWCKVTNNCVPPGMCYDKEKIDKYYNPCIINGVEVPQWWSLTPKPPLEDSTAAPKSKDTGKVACEDFDKYNTDGSCKECPSHCRSLKDGSGPCGSCVEKISISRSSTESRVSSDDGGNIMIGGEVFKSGDDKLKCFTPYINTDKDNSMCCNPRRIFTGTTGVDSCVVDFSTKNIQAQGPGTFGKDTLKEWSDTCKPTINYTKCPLNWTPNPRTVALKASEGDLWEDSQYTFSKGNIKEAPVSTNVCEAPSGSCLIGCFENSENVVYDELR